MILRIAIRRKVRENERIRRARENERIRRVRETERTIKAIRQTILNQKARLRKIQTIRVSLCLLVK